MPITLGGSVDVYGFELPEMPKSGGKTVQTKIARERFDKTNVVGFRLSRAYVVPYHCAGGCGSVGKQLWRLKWR
jgi:hypothetical protein